MRMNTRSYSEMRQLKTFEERFEYLKLDGRVGKDTFGYDRYLREMLHKLPEWRTARRDAIVRDNGCDLGMPDRKIPDGVKVFVHHINPITVEDILNRDPKLFDPNNLITTMQLTHNAIHYGDSNLLARDPIERTANDTCPWKR